MGRKIVLVLLQYISYIKSNTEVDINVDPGSTPLYIECGVDYVEVTVNRTNIKGDYNDIDLNMLGFRNNDRCISWSTDSIHHFRAPLGDCGFQRQTNDSHIVYFSHIKATLMMHDPQRIVMYSGKNIMFPVSCTYPVSLRTTLSLSADGNYTASDNFTLIDSRPETHVIELPAVSGFGQFRAAMALYSDGSFLSPMSSKPSIQHDDMLFVGVFLVDSMAGEDRRKLILRSCWASPSNSTNDEIKFVLIDQPGCANHSMVEIIENGETTQARFTSDVFAFSGYTEVYLFCDISICFDQCKPICNARGKRQAKQRRSSNHDYQVISLGPITLTEKERVALWEENIEGLSDVNLRNIALAGGIVAFVLLVSLSVYFLARLRHGDNLSLRCGLAGLYSKRPSEPTFPTTHIVAF